MEFEADGSKADLNEQRARVSVLLAENEDLLSRLAVMESTMADTGKALRESKEALQALRAENESLTSRQDVL